MFFFFFSSRRRHTRWPRDWSSDVCSSDLARGSRPSAPPALLTSTFTRGIAAQNASTLCRSVTSSGRYSASSGPATSRSRSRRRAPSTRANPAACSAAAVAAPIPLLAPVMTATGRSFSTPTLLFLPSTCPVSLSPLEGETNSYPLKVRPRGRSAAKPPERRAVNGPVKGEVYLSSDLPGAQLGSQLC